MLGKGGGGGGESWEQGVGAGEDGVEGRGEAGAQGGGELGNVPHLKYCLMI